MPACVTSRPTLLGVVALAAVAALSLSACGSADDSEGDSNERFQRCLSRVRMALAIDVIRFGLHRDLLKIRQDLSRAIPRSTGARDVASARLTVRSVGVSCPPGGRLRPVVTQGPAPV